MRPGQHGNFRPLPGQLSQRVNETLQSGVIHFMQRVFQRTGYCRVIYVLRGETEVDELLEVTKSKRVELFFEKIFHRLHVVVGHLLYVLYPGGILICKVGTYCSQGREKLLRNGLQLLKRQLTQGDEILHLDLHPIANQGILGKITGVAFRLGTITTVDRRNRCQLRQIHGCVKTM